MTETDYGVFCFKGNEEEVALRWMWTLLCDLTWFRVWEVCLRIIFKKPPKWVFNGN